MPPRRAIAEEREGAMRIVAAGVMVSAALAAPMAAYAQGDQQQQNGGYIKRVEPREHERIVITENVGYTPSFGLGYTDEGRVRLTATGQSTQYTVDYNPRHAIQMDLGLIVMLNRTWGIGGNYNIAYFDYAMTSSNAAILGRNTIEDESERRERTARLELTRVLFRSENLSDPFDETTTRPTGVIIRVFGGPAYHHLKQHVVTFKASDPDLRKGTGWGYHAGVDFSMYTGIPGLGGGGIGFGATARYSRGSVSMPGLLDEMKHGWPTGGWSLGGGIRFRL
jgi:hypothetical protein